MHCDWLGCKKVGGRVKPEARQMSDWLAGWNWDHCFIWSLSFNLSTSQHGGVLGLAGHPLRLPA